ncbi:hypothetical protein K8R66_01580 [bacterium]|nr:hypothetical protein [bacterium]
MITTRRTTTTKTATAVRSTYFESAISTVSEKEAREYERYLTLSEEELLAEMDKKFQSS